MEKKTDLRKIQDGSGIIYSDEPIVEEQRVTRPKEPDVREVCQPVEEVVNPIE